MPLPYMAILHVSTVKAAKSFYLNWMEIIQLVSSFKVTSGTGPRDAHMAIANGLLFIRHGKVLMAYDLKQRS